ncbi:helicase associated domain-containing protein [Marisediminicola antarctica]|nr:helicase associated domain-containing protein [Marisediminicola antarctica]
MEDGPSREPADRLEQRWLATYGQIRSFRATKGKLPLEAGVGSEATLGGWLRNQRRRHKRGRMPAWQADLLQRIPGFVWEPAVGAWWVKLELLRAFLEREGRVPRYRSVDAGERELAAWVHKQRHHFRQGRLRPDRAAALRRLPFKIV